MPVGTEKIAGLWFAKGGGGGGIRTHPPPPTRTQADTMGWMRLCVIHNSFTLYDGGVIRACLTNKGDCQWIQALSKLIT